jgi:DNA uptake protein ComE-like DNA-binding protein
LEEVEARADEAEARAARAEELAAAKAEEEGRTNRLREMLDRIAEAEERASSAEERARRAVDSVAEPPSDLSPTPEAEAVPPAFEPQPGEPVSPPEAEATGSEETPEWFSTSLGADAVPAEPEQPEAVPAESWEPEPSSLPDGPTNPVAINTATYEDLRTLGLSVTQTGRVLAYRERIGGFGTLDDLDKIPGFPTTFLDVLKTKIVI